MLDKINMTRFFNHFAMKLVFQSRLILICGVLLLFISCISDLENSGTIGESISSREDSSITINRLIRDIGDEGGLEFWGAQLAEKLRRGEKCSISDLPKGCRCKFSIDIIVNTEPGLATRMGIEQNPMYTDTFPTSQDRTNVAKAALEDLVSLAKEGYPPACLILVSYYEAKGVCERGLYWTFAAAEVGCPEAMLWLCENYSQGKGVIQDTAESIKWRILAAARGDLNSQKEIRKVRHIVQNEPVFLEAQKRAIDWQQKHLSVFMSP
jgi:hypothetical protein